MSKGNTADLDRAIVTTLRADSALLALLSDGVYLDIALQNSARYVLVTLIDANDEARQGGTAWETKLYEVSIVARTTNYGDVDVDAAAYRVHELLHDGSIVLPDPYSLMSCVRIR